MTWRAGVEVGRGGAWQAGYGMDTNEAQKMIDELMGEQEDLDPELAQWYEEIDGIPFIRHPLVYSALHTDIENALVNKRLKYKKGAVKEALEQKNWRQFVWLHERPYRIDAFNEISEELEDQEYWTLLSSIWRDSENIWQMSNEWREALTCERLDQQYMMDEDERAALEQDFDDEITVYRGYCEHGSAEGFSYTTNRVVAKFFAKRLAREGETRHVVIGKVKKSDVIAFMDGRSEYEIVCLPEHVTLIGEDIVDGQNGEDHS